MSKRDGDDDDDNNDERKAASPALELTEADFRAIGSATRMDPARIRTMCENPHASAIECLNMPNIKAMLKHIKTAYPRYSALTMSGNKAELVEKIRAVLTQSWNPPIKPRPKKRQKRSTERPGHMPNTVHISQPVRQLPVWLGGGGVSICANNVPPKLVANSGISSTLSLEPEYKSMARRGPFFEHATHLGDAPVAYGRWTVISVPDCLLSGNSSSGEFLHLRLFQTLAGDRGIVPWIRGTFAVTVGIDHLESKQCEIPVLDKRSTVAKPLDLSHYREYLTRGRDLQISVYTSDISFNGRVFLETANARSAAELIREVPKHKFGEQKDETNTTDVVVEDVVLSLKCPLTLERPQTPVRGMHCEHRACFDLETYVGLCSGSGNWKCPLCFKPLPYNELRIDESMVELLRLHPTGVLLGDRKIGTASKKRKSSAVVEPTDIDDDSPVARVAIPVSPVAQVASSSPKTVRTVLVIDDDDDG